MSWKESLQIAKDYVNNCDGIKVTPHMFSILKDECRDEYYKRCEDVQREYVKENYQHYVDLGYEIAANYKPLTDSFTQVTGFDIVEDQEFKWFFKDAEDGLMRVIDNFAEKAACSRITEEQFEIEAKARLDLMSKRYVDYAYKRFIQVSLLSLCHPKKSYMVHAIDNYAENCMGEGHEKPGQHKDRCPFPEEISGINFTYNPIISFIVPNALVDVNESYYLAMRTDFTEAEWTSMGFDESIEYLDIPTLRDKYNLFNLRPDLTKKTWFELDAILPTLALYVDQNVNRLNLISDYARLLRPSANIEIVDEVVDWEVIKRHDDATQPKAGTYVVTRYDLEVPEDLPESIHVLKVGYDTEALMPIMEALNTLMEN